MFIPDVYISETAGRVVLTCTQHNGEAHRVLVDIPCCVPVGVEFHIESDLAEDVFDKLEACGLSLRVA